MYGRFTESIVNLLLVVYFLISSCQHVSMLNDAKFDLQIHDLDISYNLYGAYNYCTRLSWCELQIIQFNPVTNTGMSK
jgi:hypothetical protein